MKTLNFLTPWLVLAGMLAADVAWAAAKPESEYSLDGIAPVLADHRARLDAWYNSPGYSAAKLADDVAAGVRAGKKKGKKQP